MASTTTQRPEVTRCQNSDRATHAWLRRTELAPRSASAVASAGGRPKAAAAATQGASGQDRRDALRVQPESADEPEATEAKA